MKLIGLLLAVCLSTPLFAAITEGELDAVFTALKNAYPDEKIDLNALGPTPDFWWNLEAPRASYSASKNSEGEILHHLFFFGGLARLPEMSPEGAALILCHELGHGIAGPPLKRGSSSSVEGEADYFATYSCLPRLLSYLSWDSESIISGIAVQLVLINKQGAAANYEERDEQVVEEINQDPSFYPGNQCRLDTLLAGARREERPRCWWVPN